MGWQDRDYARQTTRPPPPGGFSGARAPGLRGWSIVTVLIAVNVGVHLLRPMAPTATIPTVAPARNPSNPREIILVKQDMVADAPFALGTMHTERVLHGQVWRLFTSQYLHAQGLMHLFLNMLGLYFFGPALESRWGPRKFFAIYTLGGLCGNILLMVLGIIGWINPYTPALGASGCILGLLGACAVLFPHAEVWVYFLFPLKIRTAAMLLAAGYVYNIWRQGSNFGGDACHIAGLAFGAWYAKYGAVWWDTRGSRFFSSLAARRASSGQWGQRIEQRRADAELVDELLAKVYEGGLHSLTQAERTALTAATKRQKAEEERLGRTDRL